MKERAGEDETNVWKKSEMADTILSTAHARPRSPEYTTELELPLSPRTPVSLSIYALLIHPRGCRTMVTKKACSAGAPNHTSVALAPAPMPNSTLFARH